MHAADRWRRKQAPRGVDLNCPHLTGGVTRQANLGMEFTLFSLGWTDLVTGSGGGAYVDLADQAQEF